MIGKSLSNRHGIAPCHHSRQVRETGIFHSRDIMPIHRENLRGNIREIEGVLLIIVCKVCS